MYRNTKASIQIWLVFFSSIAICGPAGLALNISPSATFANQVVALIGWGAFFALVSLSLDSVRLVDRRSLVPMVILWVSLLFAVGASYYIQQFPSTLTLSALGLLLGAGLVVFVGRMNDKNKLGQLGFRAICIAMVAAGGFSVALASIQIFSPQLSDGEWIAHAATPGRAGGNLRQPNHLSSLLLSSISAWIFLHEVCIEKTRPFALMVLRLASAALISMLLFGVVLTVSRTGTVCVVFLALWGIVDKQLSRYTRALLWLAPMIYSLCWLGMSEWSQMVAHQFAGGSQLHKTDLSSSRFGIWSNTLSLIAQNPWFGVGWGEFNFAWTLTPFPGRPPAFFDHTHNLVLQFLVELGIPLGGAVLALLGYGLWKAFRACLITTDSSGPMVRTAFVMVSMMVIHSMLEYPLWYAYFLLPTAFAFGICLGHSEPKKSESEEVRETTEVNPSAYAIWTRRALLTGSAAMVIGSIYSVFDYMKVSQIFAPSANAPPLSVRIAEGQRSIFFAHHADYAAATTAAHPSEVMDSFKRATHYLLDTRLMMAWAKAFNESGDVERARYIAARLREFHNAQSDDFFAECDSPREPGEALPFQCTPPTKQFTYKDFR